MIQTRRHPRATATMGTTMGLMLASLLAVALVGCDRSSSSSPRTTLEGGWLGQGTFRASVGEAQVKAQLDLLEDGSYRLLILEPGILALTGAEEGRWLRDGQTLTLTPAAAAPRSSQGGDPAAGGSAFQQLRQGSDVASKPPKTLTIAADLRNLRFDDGTLELTFLPHSP